MASNRIGRVATCLVAPLLAGGAVAAQAGPASAGSTVRPAPAGSTVRPADTGTTGPNSYQGPVFVSPGGSPSGGGQSCDTARFTSIQAAVNAAASGGSVVVCAGTYQQQVVIAKPLTLTGQHATIDETGVASTARLDEDKAAVVILSSNVKFTGFTVQNAQGDGILAAGLDGDITRITISRDSIVDNGSECASCGDGVQLTGVANATISHNTISGNSGGILLSDDTGPTDGNVLENNTISGNSAGSGITVLGRNTQALTGSGQPQSSVAGVYRNSIKHNQVTGNGGAGVMLAGAAGGTAAYDNLVSANYIAGNGLAGVTLRAGQGQDLSGNEVTSNVIDTNNTAGDTDLLTTGVLVFSAGPPVTIRIGTNHVSNNAVGIWLTQAVSATDLNSNTFTSVTTPISANH